MWSGGLALKTVSPLGYAIVAYDDDSMPVKDWRLRQAGPCRASDV
jgi:hypothetical protein